ncbi:uvrD/REP helicase N-terminal domain protein [Candidatus Phytoplasma oryzae]|uniref:DNA 3'-5' helicase n=1 Tax=Candidatus Phytoplasma oryzae TaxID=203274 RepID=A0A139JQZ1_9MOLU|nr:UvrD-helicase domain-containing protein [Candidatus Phytoplasma oryzae]KXT29382.1 uvrD/REP helicase N-terminal domain protein [Candidatus Phytoplasma oryzae]RAM57967.1 hypothetical protein DH96_00140 [Candidatus Phytoplasma oryzae]
MFLKWIQNLNEEQKKIIQQDKKSIYVLAGAGTGKTKTLTAKIIFLLKKLKIRQENILAITFTNNAAQEMKERLYKILEEDFSNLNVETFHSLSNKILKKYEKKTNLDFNSYFSIINEQESKIIIKEQIKKLKLDKNFFSVNKIKNAISYYKTQLLRNQIFKKIGLLEKFNIEIEKKNLFNRTEFIRNFNYIQNIFVEYQNFLVKNNLFDFDDLVINSYKLLKENKYISDFYQSKFLYILIDEFQDIDIIQYQMMKILGKNSILFVVGDPNQNIYNFRGSDIICSNLFLQDFKASIYRLFKNYRSTEEILSKANLLIENNYKTEKIFKNQLKSVKGNGKNVFYKHFLNSYLESQFIIQEIQKLMKYDEYNYGDFAILYRLNDINKDIENHLIMKNIPYLIQGYISFYNKIEVKVFINYLNAILNPEKDFYLKKIINIPSRKIGLKTIEKLENISFQKKISLFKVIQTEVKQKTKIGKKVANFYKIFEQITKIFHNEDECDLTNVILIIDDIIGYSSAFKKQKLFQNLIDMKQEEIKKNIIRLQNIFTQYSFPDQKINFFEKINFLLSQINLSYTNNVLEKQNKVILSSIHKAKGLEFKIVFFIGLEEKVFLSNKENIFNYYNYSLLDKKEEERRLAYVAITRAQESLYITSVQNRFLFGQNISSKPICFIEEMKLESLPKNNSYFSNKKDKQKLDNIYHISENIEHKNFGIGKIISIYENIVIVSFLPPYGIKKILITHPAIKKIL